MRRILLAILCLTAAACGSSAAEDAAPTVASTLRPTTTTTESTTTVPRTTVPAKSTTSTSASSTTTTTIVTLPNPDAPPLDDRGFEPYVELGSIEIPKIELWAPLLEGIRLTTLDQGPGHWPGTAMPGEQGNTVVAGHRTSHNREFRDLDQLAAGDEVFLTTADGRFAYRVVSTEIVQPTEIRIIDQTTAYTATLFACHPPGSVRERIVVHLQLVA